MEVEAVRILVARSSVTKKRRKPEKGSCKWNLCFRDQDSTMGGGWTKNEEAKEMRVLVRDW